jgi:hypothetical protein
MQVLFFSLIIIIIIIVIVFIHYPLIQEPITRAHPPAHNTKHCLVTYSGYRARVAWRRTCTWSQIWGQRIWRQLSTGLCLVWKRGAVNSPFNHTLFGLFLGKSTRNLLLGTEDKVSELFVVSNNPRTAAAKIQSKVSKPAVNQVDDGVNEVDDGVNEVDAVNEADVLNEVDAGARMLIACSLYC